MIDLSDEATGLPPMSDVEPEKSLLALQWEIGHDGVVAIDGQYMAVQYLSLRGLQLDEGGVPVFSQLHVAIPTDGLLDLIQEWQRRLDEPLPTELD